MYASSSGGIHCEFFWRYSLRPDIKHAELIDGVVYVASPVNPQKHGRPHFRLITKLGVYAEATPGVVGADNSTVRLREDTPDGMTSQPQPDAMLYWDNDHGGNAEIDEEGWLLSAPELVAEVSYSSRSYDLFAKKDLYRRIGVREYICWQVEERQIDWWQLVDGQFVDIEPDGAGAIHSLVFSGLSLDIPDLLARTPVKKLPRPPRGVRL